MTDTQDPAPLAGGNWAYLIEADARANTALRKNFQQLRRQRQIEHICRIPRLIYKLIDEIDRYHDPGEDLDRRLARYAAADRDRIRAVSGDRFPPSPIRAVRGAR